MDVSQFERRIMLERRIREFGRLRVWDCMDGKESNKGKSLRQSWAIGERFRELSVMCLLI